MRTFVKAATVLLVCLLASPLFGGDCSDVSGRIGPLKNKPQQLKRLLDKAPQCGEVWEALGDYYYKKRIWNDAYSNYEQALKYMPGNTRVSSRLDELRPKLTTLINDEQDMIKWRRRIGGTTDSVPQSFASAPAPAPGVQPDNTQLAALSRQSTAQPARSQVQASKPSSKTAAQKSSSKKSADSKTALASRGESSATQSARSKIDKVALMIHFNYNSSELTPEGKKLLDGFAEILNKELADRTFLIQGHTDDTGSREYNIKLSLDRAAAVSEYLSQRGVDVKRLSVQGYGYDKPIYDNSTELGRSKNRRVEFEEK